MLGWSSTCYHDLYRFFVVEYVVSPRPPSDGVNSVSSAQVMVGHVRLHYMYILSVSSVLGWMSEKKIWNTIENWYGNYNCCCLYLKGCVFLKWQSVTICRLFFSEQQAKQEYWFLPRWTSPKRKHKRSQTGTGLCRHCNGNTDPAIEKVRWYWE